jgi:hypothetical protein
MTRSISHRPPCCSQPVGSAHLTYGVLCRQERRNPVPCCRACDQSVVCRRSKRSALLGAAGTALRFSFRVIGVVDAEAAGAMSSKWAELGGIRLKAAVQTGARPAIDPDEPQLIRLQWMARLVYRMPVTRSYSRSTRRRAALDRRHPDSRASGRPPRCAGHGASVR